MSARKTEQETAVRHPRETADLFGHREAETALLNAYRSGRIPHAWLIGGPQGIGKATLAYRMARFVLANSNPMSPSVQRASARRGSTAPDRFEAEDLDFHRHLREAYRKIAAAEPQRCVLIDANADATTVAASIAAALRDRFSPASAGTMASPA